MGRPGLLQSALSTANAVEMLLSRGNGTVLALDELALMRGEIIDRHVKVPADGHLDRLDGHGGGRHRREDALGHVHVERQAA